MNEDLADGLLLDVRTIGIADLLLEDPESGLARALDRLLSSHAEHTLSSFTSRI